MVVLNFQMIPLKLKNAVCDNKDYSLLFCFTHIGNILPRRGFQFQEKKMHSNIEFLQYHILHISQQMYNDI